MGDEDSQASSDCDKCCGDSTLTFMIILPTGTGIIINRTILDSTWFVYLSSFLFTAHMKGLLPLLCHALLGASAAPLFLPAIFSDFMVLQGHASYDQRPFIYGEATPGDFVHVTRTTPNGNSANYLATVDADGAWIVQLDPDYFPGSQNDLTVEVWAEADPNDVRTFVHVAYGDVFLCSGQSNMNENVAAVFNASETMSRNFTNIRLFSVVEGGAAAPQRDFFPSSAPGALCSFPQFHVNNSKQVCNSWQIANEPTIIGTFSATCFYTALALSEQLTGNRIIGLVHASVSGTPMRQWAPPEALSKCDAPSQSIVDTEHSLLAPPLPSDNSTLFNAMINPLSRYAIRAIIWNQGESDSGESPLYFSCLFQSLVESYRRRWRIGDFAWLFAQLGAQDSSKWPNYFMNFARGAQSAVLPGAVNSTTNTIGMAAAYDIGDMSSPYPPYHVHSRRKQELGRRLALALIHVQYALQWPASPGLINLTASSNWGPPAVSGLSLSGSSSVSVDLRTLDGLGVFMHETADAWETCASTGDMFQVSADGTQWINTTVVLSSGSAVAVTAKQNVDIAFVRYAPNLWPQCALYAVGNSLPLIPFEIPVPAQKVDAMKTLSAAPSHLQRFVTPRVEGAWADGWRGVKIPKAIASSKAAATPPMGFNR